MWRFRNPTSAMADSAPIIAPEPEAAKPAVKARPRSKSDERKPGKVTSAKADHR